MHVVAAKAQGEGAPTEGKPAAESTVAEADEDKKKKRSRSDSESGTLSLNGCGIESSSTALKH
jgi:hypothetical protein